MFFDLDACGNIFVPGFDESMKDQGERDTALAWLAENGIRAEQ